MLSFKFENMANELVSLFMAINGNVHYCPGLLATR
jgi:hypothetical protein